MPTEDAEGIVCLTQSPLKSWSARKIYAVSHRSREEYQDGSEMSICDQRTCPRQYDAGHRMTEEKLKKKNTKRDERLRLT